MTADGHLSWCVVSGALCCNALAAFPDEESELAPHRAVTPVGLVTPRPDVPPPFRLTPRAA